jgi:hypothetical protein
MVLQWRQKEMSRSISYLEGKIMKALNLRRNQEWLPVSQLKWTDVPVICWDKEKTGGGTPLIWVHYSLICHSAVILDLPYVFFLYWITYLIFLFCLLALLEHVLQCSILRKGEEIQFWGPIFFFFSSTGDWI